MKLKRFLEWLRKQGAHKIIRAYFVGFILWTFLAGNLLDEWFPGDWMGLWVLVLILGSSAVLLLVVFGNVGSTWNDKE
jgi:hypothetical protein